MEWQLMWKKLR